MKWILMAIFLTIIEIEVHMQTLNLSLQEGDYHRLSDALDFASQDATLDVTTNTDATGVAVFNQTEANATFRATLARNLNLDPTTLAPRPNSMLSTAPTILDEQFFDGSNTSFPYTYTNSTYGLNVTLNNPTLVLVVQFTMPSYAANVPTYTVTLPVIQSYDPMQVPTIPSGIGPHISSVLFNTKDWGPEMTITGTGFGSAPSSSALALSVLDSTRNWKAVNIPSGVTLQISSWSNTKIVVSGFNGYGGGDPSLYSDGLGNWVFAPKDHLTVTVINPQSKLQGTFHVQYPTNAPMPGNVIWPHQMSLGTVNASTNTVTNGWMGLPLGAPVVWNHPATPLANAANGTPLVFATTVNTSSNVLHFALNCDDTATVYVDGKPQYVATYGASNFSVSVTPGEHTIEVFAENTGGENPVTDSPANPAGLSVQVTDGSGNTLASTATNPSAWEVLQPTAGAGAFDPYLFQGTTQAVGVWNPSASLSMDSGIPTGPSVMPGTQTIQATTSTVITGQLLLNGKPLPNQAVAITASSGTLSPASTGGSYTTDGKNVFMTTTNAQGEWMVTYTAPAQAGTVTIQASGDSEISTKTVNVFPPPQITGVSWNTSVWPPQPTITGSHFGSSASNEYVQIFDHTRGWQGATANSGVAFTVGTWNDNTITVTNMGNYANGGGQWLFAPGDSLTVNVTNPQTGFQGLYNTTYPSNASMPTVTLNPPANMDASTTQTITGRVTFGGQGVAGQTVTFTA